MLSLLSLPHRMPVRGESPQPRVSLKTRRGPCAAVACGGSGVAASLLLTPLHHVLSVTAGKRSLVLMPTCLSSATHRRWHSEGIGRCQVWKRKGRDSGLWRSCCCKRYLRTVSCDITLQQLHGVEAQWALDTTALSPVCLTTRLSVLRTKGGMLKSLEGFTGTLQGGLRSA